MAFGSYRLSIDEQQVRIAEAAHASRFNRIADVRRQSNLFAAEQREKYKTSLAAAESSSRRQQIASWEAKREQTVRNLLRQYGREMQHLGRAQIDASQAALLESASQSEMRLQEEMRNDRKRQRFSEALRRVRKSETVKRRVVARLVGKRKEEMERGREIAAQYNQTRSTESTAVAQVNERVLRERKREKEAAIDFRFSRTHQQLGTMDAVRHHSQERRENALVAAESERARILVLEGVAERERVEADDRARDRGEVALLRERAIVQKQLYEADLRRIQRSERKRLAKDVVKGCPLAHRVQKAANTEAAEEDVRQALADLEKKHSDQAQDVPATNRLPARTGYVDLGIQTDTENKRPHSSRSRKPEIQLVNKSEESGGSHKDIDVQDTNCRELNKTVTKCPASTQTIQTSNGTTQKKVQKRLQLSPQTKNLAPKANSARQNPPKPLNQEINRPNTRPVPKKEAQKKPKKINNTAVTSERKPAHSSLSAQDPEPKKQAGLEPAALEKSPTAREFARPDANFDDDALSEALSMDTDLFMLKYFNTTNSGIPVDSDISDNDRLDELSALLASSDAGGQSMEDLSDIHSSDLELCMLSASLPRPASVTISDSQEISSPLADVSTASSWEGIETPFISESDLASSNCSSNSNQLAEMDALFRGLDKISGNSLTLLSSLSNLLASQTTSDNEDEESIRPTDISISQSTSTQEERTTTSNTASSGHANSTQMTQTESLVLDTILEESDGSLISISTSSASQQAMPRPESSDLSVESVSLLDCLDFLSESASTHN